jgi:predicted RNA-binding Zn-ribbon protein involved in translation (DUF1610 family)
MSGEPGPDPPPEGPPPGAAPEPAPESLAGAADEAPSQTITCPACGSVFDRRYLTECCRYEAGQGYRCANCNHFLEREATGE